MAPVRSQRGLTLIELTIAVAVAGVLSSVALPGFEGQLQKARRADALVAAVQVQAAQERYRGNAASYGSLGQIGLPATSAAGHYGLQVAAFDADGYELLAIAVGVQSRDRSCRYMKLVANGMNLAYASGQDAAVANPVPANRRCWNL